LPAAALLSAQPPAAVARVREALALALARRPSLLVLEDLDEARHFLDTS